MPAAFAWTNDAAPAPTWQSTHLTFAWGPIWCATNSGFIGRWQTWPQNATESMYSTPRYAARDTMTIFSIVRVKTRTAILRWPGSLRSILGHSTVDAGLPAARRRRSIHAPSGMSASPSRNTAGRIRKKTTPM